MGKYYNIIIGERHNRFIILKELEKRNNTRIVQVVCDCGKEKIVSLSSIVNGYSKSCGCLQKESMYKAAGKHHLSDNPLYKIYYDIKKRCYNKKSVGYKNYGGRGIVMCEEWLNDVSSFINWGDNNGFKKGLQIDRIDNNSNYDPSNCRWVSRHENHMNRRNTVYLEYRGETKTMYDWSIQLNIKYKVLKDRIQKLKWDIEKAFNY